MQSSSRVAARMPCRSAAACARTPGRFLLGERRSVSSAASALAVAHEEDHVVAPSRPAPSAVPSLTPHPAAAAVPSRWSRIRDAKPFSDFLTDTFQRQHDYLRISISERCNLRCLYCMPEEGVPLSPDRNLLTTPEILLLSSIFVSQGVTKIRLTGGEPTVRRDILPLMRQLGDLRPKGLKELCITTNGISLHRKLEGMVESGLTGVNLSLDTLDPWQFQVMTRRKGFDAVQKSIDRVLELNSHGAGIKLKINCVVMRGLNDREILPFVELTRDKDLEVRFIEYMPFDGNKWNQGKMFSYSEMLDAIRERHPGLAKVQDDKNDTSKTWRVPGYVGRVGFITSMTHNFCGTCNRLRLTGDGSLKVCLFGNSEVSLRDILRKSNGGEPIDEQAFEAIRANMERDRRKQDLHNHNAGVPNEKELLDTIGMAVKRKKAKHAGIGELEHMKNRPMILIESPRMPRILEPIRSSLAGPMPPSVRHLLLSETPLLPRTRAINFSRPGHCHMSTTSPRYKRDDKDDDSKNTNINKSSSSSSSSSSGGGGGGGSPRLTHVAESGSARMVSIADKPVTSRIATAVCHVRFSSDTPVQLIRDNALKKGDVLGVARVAGIMAAKRTADLIPLCHPIAISQVQVEVAVAGDREVGVRATVGCEGKTGVEMEALTAAGTAALTVYDMCKAVDRGMEIGGLRVVLKDGGRSGRWELSEESSAEE